MPRSFGGGRSNSRGRSSSSSSRPSSSYGSSSGQSHHARAQPSYTQQTHIQRPGMFGGGMGSAIATGMAFGGGSEIGHSLTRSMMGNHEVQHSQPQYPSQQNQTENVDKLSDSVNQQLKVNT